MAFELKKEGFKLRDVLSLVQIPESTYHYQVNRLSEEDPNQALKEEIIKLFNKHDGRYGYRRIHLVLRNQGHLINHKKVQLIMN